ncbi:MAG: hypothetical protein PF692_13890 [Kiritimatiellae bacterium]|jgi:hypothetical protein|nr:hypothetical protein [Kiritimatiellia bacterium]
MKYETLFDDPQLDYSIVVNTINMDYFIVINRRSLPFFRKVYRLTADEIRRCTKEDSRLLDLATALISESSPDKYDNRLVTIDLD